MICRGLSKLARDRASGLCALYTRMFKPQVIMHLSRRPSQNASHEGHFRHAARKRTIKWLGLVQTCLWPPLVHSSKRVRQLLDTRYGLLIGQRARRHNEQTPLTGVAMIRFQRHHGVVTEDVAEATMASTMTARCMQFVGCSSDNLVQSDSRFSPLVGSSRSN
mgnify:FL=1